MLQKVLKIHLINPNTKKVWEALESDLTLNSYTGLVERTGLSRSTIYDALYRLEKDRLVKRVKDKSDGSKGRPKVHWESNLI